MERKKDLICVAALFLAAYVFLGNVFFFGRTLLPADVLQFQLPWGGAPAAETEFHNSLISDAILQSYPWREHSLRSLRQGVVPLWNPYQFSGAPHAANAQSGIFYPPAHVVFSIMGVKHGLGVAALLHMWLAGIGVFLLLRLFGAGRAGAVFGAMAFMFSGWFVVWLSRPEFIYTAAWLPFMFLGYCLAVERGRARYAVIGAAAFGMQLLAGHLQMAFYSAMALALLFVFQAIFGRAASAPAWKRISASALAFAIIMGLGAGIGAVQLSISYELFTLSPRLESAGAESGVVMGFARSLAPYVHLVLPDFFGNPAQHNIWKGYSYAETFAYCGIIPVFFAGLALVRPRNAARMFFAALAVFSLLIAARTPVYGLLLHAFPTIGVFSAGRFGLLFCFAMAMLSGFGVDALARTGQRPARFQGSGLWICAMLCVVAGILLLSAIGTYEAIGWKTLWRMQAHGLIRFLVFMALCAAIPAVCVRLGATWAVALSFVLLMCDLLAWGVGFNTASDSKLVFPRSGFVDAVKADHGEPYRFHAFMTGSVRNEITGQIMNGNILEPNSATVFELEDTRGYDSLFYNRYRDLVRAFQERRAAGSFVEGAWLSFTAPDATLLKLLNVKYVATSRPVHQYRPELEYLDDIEGVNLYRFKPYLPRAYAVKNYEVAGNDKEILGRMLAPGFDPGVSVVLRKPPEFIRSHSAPRRGKQWIRSNRKSVNETHIQANILEPSILVISEIDYPGWRMQVQGKEIPYQQANYCFRAVALAPGYYEIRFLFRPDSARRGMAISMAALMCALGMALLMIVKTARPENSKLR